MVSITCITSITSITSIYVQIIHPCYSSWQIHPC
jgi:hypothetical protein